MNSAGNDAAFAVQRAYRRFRFRSVFAKQVAALRVAECASTDEILALLSPGEQQLARDPLAGVRVRFRFTGEDGEFPPRLVYKLYAANRLPTQYLSGATHFHASLDAEVQAARQMGQRQNLRVHRHFLGKVHVPLLRAQHDRRGHLRRLDELDRRPVSLGGRGNAWRPIGVSDATAPQKWEGACAIDTIPVKGLRMPHHDKHWHSAHRHTMKPTAHHVASRTHAPGLHAVHAFTKHMGNTRRSTRPPGVADTRGATSSRPLPYSSRSMPHDAIPGEGDEEPHLHVYKGDGDYHERHKAWEHEKPGVPQWRVSRISPHAPPVNDSTMDAPRQTLRALRRSTAQLKMKTRKQHQRPRTSLGQQLCSTKPSPSLMGSRPNTAPAKQLAAAKKQQQQRQQKQRASLASSSGSFVGSAAVQGLSTGRPQTVPAGGSGRKHKSFEWRVDGDHHRCDFEHSWLVSY